MEFAKENARRAGYGNVETQAADGENLKVEEASFDAAICRLGLMFFPDPGKGLRAMFQALKPGGMACTMVFSTPVKNPCATILVSTALKHADLPNGSTVINCGSASTTSMPTSRKLKRRFHQRRPGRQNPDRRPSAQACRRICPARICVSTSSIRSVLAVAVSCM